MSKQGECIRIVRKDGKVAVVPLSLWENSLKFDKDWHIENRPLLSTPPVKVVPVLIEKPAAPDPTSTPTFCPLVEVPEPKVDPPAPAPEKKKRQYRRKK